MGIVYAAEHVTLGHRTACKVLRPEVMRQKDAVERFLQEARQVSKIRHNNLIDIFDIGELPDGRLYYVMEYLAGRPLSQQRARLSFPEIVNIGRQVCAGLSAAHAAGLVHRDLSPDNLFLCERPGSALVVKIMDFGVAKVVSGEASQLRLTRKGALLGTPQYMAPEQITDDPVDARTDVYALGAILFELCTGHPPFAKGTLSETLGGHLRSPVPGLDPEVLKAGIPAAMQGVLDKALAKLPAERYPSTAALAEALEKLLRASAGEGNKAPPASLRTRLLVGGLLTVLVVLAGGYVLRGWRGAAQSTPLDLVALRALALQILQQGLADPNPAVREQAVVALGQSHDSRHKELLAPYLNDPAVTVQVAAARALGEIGNRGAIAALQKRLSQPADPGLLAAGGEALLRLDEPGGRALLFEVQQQAGAPKAQLASALALAEVGERDAALAVETRLRTASASGAAGADEVMLILTRKARHGDKAAQARLQALLTAPTAPLGQRLQAASCLLSTGDERARTLLSEAVATPGPAQLTAAQLLCAADDVSGQPILRQVLAQAGKPEPERVQAALGLGSCGDKEDARTLWQGLVRGEPNPLLRQAEAGALLRLCNGDPVALAEQTTGWVQLALADGNPRVRAAGAAILGDLDPARAQPLIDRAMHDPSTEVRQSAATALGRSEDRAALLPLAAALTDDNRGVRLQIWRSIAQVALGLRGEGPGELNLSSPLTALLRQRAQQGSSGEQVAAASALLATGDSSQRSQVQKGLTSSDSEARSLALTAAEADPVLRQSALASVVDDNAQSATLRTRAAAELLSRGDQRGVGLLRATARQGGPDGLTAALALQPLGESAGKDPLVQVRELLQSTDAALRRASVAVLAKFPAEQAVPLLLELTSDADRAVRAQVAQTAAELRGRRLGSPPGLAVLRALLEDVDAGVRAQAGALVTKLQRRSSRAAEPAAIVAPAKPTGRRSPKAGTGATDEPAVSPAVDAGSEADAAADSAPVPPTAALPPDSSASKGKRSYLLIQAPAELEFQLDRQPPQTATGKPIAVAPGEHHLSHFGGQQDLSVAEGETVTVNLSVSAVAQLVQSGLEAFGRKDYRRAKKLLEKASTLCARKREERLTCNLVAFDLTYYLARVYDAQDAWAEAMTEYEKILTPGFPGKVKAPDRVAVTAAVARLGPRLGRLRVSKLVGGRCQTVNLWMPPGRHRVNVGGGQFVQVHAQETIEVKGCP
jgi:HEAT repeat protein